MTRKKVKLAWIAQENSRTLSLKKRRLGLLKKVKELTILCDVKACLIMFSPKEVEPMVWPSFEGARHLLHEFFALPEIEKRKKEMSLEQYLKEKTKKVQDQLMKTRKKNTKLKVDQLMVQLHHCGRKIDDLDLSEIYDLLSSTYSNIMIIRKKLDFVEHPPLRQPPVNPLFEGALSEELRSTRNNVFLGREHVNERGERNDEAVKRICIDNVGENQTRYLMDQWVFASPEPPHHRGHQQIDMERTSYNANPNRGRYLPFQGSSSNGASNLEMQSICSPMMMNFHGMVRPVSHPNMIMSQPRLQHPFDFMSGIKEERSNINNVDSQFHMSIRQEPRPNPNGATAQEDVTSFDINRNWLGFNNPHF